MRETCCNAHSHHAAAFEVRERYYIIMNNVSIERTKKRYTSVLRNEKTFCFVRKYHPSLEDSRQYDNAWETVRLYFTGDVLDLPIARKYDNS